MCDDEVEGTTKRKEIASKCPSNQIENEWEMPLIICVIGTAAKIESQVVVVEKRNENRRTTGV